jgi:hypothetical protein
MDDEHPCKWADGLKSLDRCVPAVARVLASLELRVLCRHSVNPGVVRFRVQRVRYDLYRTGWTLLLIIRPWTFSKKHAVNTDKLILVMYHYSFLMLA